MLHCYEACCRIYTIHFKYLLFVCPNGPPCATAASGGIELIAISIALGNKEFLHFDTEEQILCLDQTRLQ